MALSKDEFLKKSSVYLTSPSKSETPTKEKSSKEQFLKKSSINLEKSKEKVPEKSLSEDFYDFFFSQEPNPLEQGLSSALRAVGSGAAKGVDLLRSGLGKQPEFQINSKTGLPETIEPISAGNLYQQYTGYQPEGLIEQGLETGTEFLTGGALFPGGSLPQRLISDYGAGFGTELAKELGGGTASQIGGGIAGSLISPIVQTIANPRQAAINLINSFSSGLRRGGQFARQAAARLGIELPAAEVIQNPVLERISRSVAGKKGVGKEWIQRVDRQFSNAITRPFQQDPLLRQAAKETAGTATSREIENIYRTKNNNLNRQYDVVKKADKNFKTKPQPLVDYIDELKSSLPAVTPETQGIHNRINKIENEIYETVTVPQFNPQTQIIEMVPQRNVREIGLEELINLRSQLGDLSRDVRNQTGVVTKQRGLRQSLQQSLEELNKTNPDLYNRIQRLDAAKYNFHENEFGLSAINRVRRAETGEQAIKAIRNPEEYRAMSNILNQTPQGQRILNAWNQSKAESIFEPFFKEAASGRFNQENFLSLMNDPAKATWLNEIMSPNVRQNIQDIQALSQHLLNGGANLKSASISPKGHSSTEIAAFTNAIHKLFSLEPIGAVASLMGGMAPTFLAHAFVDPRFQRDLIEAAIASQNQNIPRFQKFINSAMNQLKRSSITYSKEEVVDKTKKNNNNKR